MVKGKITVIGQLPDKNNRTQFLCRCECGKERIIPGKEINRARTKFTVCICNNEQTLQYRDHPLYDVWKGMKARCRDPKHIAYSIYGGRGVTVCEEWKNSFLAFFHWAIENGWQPGMQIDKDIKGNGLLYSPESCLCVTRVENSRASGHTKLTEDIARIIKHGGQRPIALSRKYGITAATVHQIRRGLTWKEI